MSYDHDKEYMKQAKEAAKRSTCSNKQLGCILMTHPIANNIYSFEGWNGPPDILEECITCKKSEHGWKDAHKCPAVHAERRALLRVAANGICTKGSILYSYMGIPCKDCLLELIEAGVKEIVVLRETYYDELSKEILHKWIECGGVFRVYKEKEAIT